jgi:pantoate--beta-alanine ligase
MSSRNRRLNQVDRQKAVTIFQSMSLIKGTLKKGNTLKTKEQAHKMLKDNGFRIDYIEIADSKDLSHVIEWDGKQQLVVLVAAFLNDVRLIDNLLL